MAYSGDEQLATLQDGKPPETRMANASQTQGVVRRLIDNDLKRSRKRALISGLVDGNPPMNTRKLRDAGRADACNVSWGTARSYLEASDGSFYDLFSAAPGYISLETSVGPEEKRIEYNRILSKEADLIFDTDPDFDNDMQLSQNQMVLFGCGPLYFEDEYAVFPLSVQAGDFLVPERCSSKSSRWELGALLWDYFCPELFQKVVNEEAASAVGWNVPFVKKAIENAMDLRRPDGSRANDWESIQNELKSNSLFYYDDSKIIRAAHVFWKEFDGRITHAIVEREDTTEKGCEYLYLKVGKYENFNQAVAAMALDRGRGGFFHTITGLGVKMYGPLEYENRLLCSLMDKSFAPKIFFSPGTAEGKEKFQVARFGDWGLLPTGTQAIQNPIQGFLTDGLAMFHTSSELMRSNLSQYRQPVEPQKPGNPATKFEKQMEASQQGSLSNTMFSHYYKQLDRLYAEIARRLCNLNSLDQRAKDFQRRCEEQGVPREAFGRITSAKAVRAVGMGSPFLRAQTTAELIPIMGRFPETGQDNLVNDYIASRAGQSAVSRYNPHPASSKMATDQQFQATEGIAMAKIGIAPPVTANQNPVVFASTYLKAAVEALNSVRQGGNPQEVLGFLHVIGPAIAAHLQRLERDPLRKEVFDLLMERFQQLGKLTDKLQKMVAANKEKMKAQRGKQSQVLNDLQLKNVRTRTELNLKAQKQKATLQMQAAKHRQQLQIADANTASNIALQHARTVSDIHNSRLKAFKE